MPPDANAHEPVEADEVVHMRVRDEHMGEPQQMSRRERRVVAEIERERALLEAEIDVDAGVAEGVVDEAGVENRAHGAGLRQIGAYAHASGTDTLRAHA